MINIGAYDFKPMFDKSIYHTTPEEALNVATRFKRVKRLWEHTGELLFYL